MLNQLGNVLSRQTDRILIGGVIGTAPMGQYHVAEELSTMPTRELVAPLQRGMFPVYAKLTDDPERLATTTLTVFGVIAILMLAAGFGIAAVAEDLTIVLLGEQWRPIIPLVSWLGLLGAVAGASNSLSTVLFVTGHGRFTTVKTWLEVVATAIALSITVRIGGLEDIAAVRTAVAIPTLPLMIYFTTRCTALSARDLVGVLWRPLGAAIVMLFVVRGVEGVGPQGHAVGLVTGTAVGGATYIGVLLFLWLLSGRPTGPEASILGYVKGKLVRSPVAA